ncbi:sigma 54-interacting transcriptional regulator [bacterium SCSIO 12741]|nr:sigma 54-interacting transcriptional regulator [bacterium SCSIO 12741]
MAYHPYFDFTVLGSSLLAGIIFTFIGLKRKSAPIYSLFGITCLVLFVHYLLVEIPVFFPTVEEYILITKIANILGGVFYALLSYFTFHYTQAKEKKLLYSLFLFTAGILAISTLRPYMFFDHISDIVTIPYQHTDIYEVVGTQGNWGIPLFFYLLAITVVNFYWSLRAYLKNKNRQNLITMALFGTMVFSVVNDNLLLDYLGLNTVYLTINVFFMLIVVMSLQLANSVLNGFDAMDKLGVNEKRWSELFQKVKLSVIQIDNEGQIQYTNPYFNNLSGYDSSSIIGQNTSLLFTDQEHQASFFPEHFKTKTGSIRIFDWWLVTLKNEKGVQTGTMAIGADRTEIVDYQNEQKKLIRQLRDLEQQLRAENLYLKDEVMINLNSHNIIGESKALLKALHKTEQVAPTDATVLLEGETGSGKELFAQAIYQNSKRKNRSFVKVNCAALPKDLIESELFGHEKGAFTGALQKRKGRFEMAHEGTLFLDEIGEMPMALQAKLLRVLQSGEFERIGSETTQKVNVRIIAATNRNLLEDVGAGTFREDLYYRLNVYPIQVPSLRERKDDIPLLVKFFVQKNAVKLRKKISQISPRLIHDLMQYSWPGNIRELQNVIERAVIVSENEKLVLADPLFAQNGSPSRPSRFKSLKEMEREHIQQVLEHCNYKIEGIEGAAEILRINPSTLRSRIKKLEIIKPVS